VFARLALLAACSAPNVPLPLDSEDSRAPPDSPPPDSAARDTGVEQIPDVDVDLWSTPPLCHVAMECGREVPDDAKVPCRLRLTAASGVVLYDGWAGAELRGRSSASFPKHQYNLELWADETGTVTVSPDLWGMGGDSDWVLNGNYADRALFRNKLGYDLFQAMGGPERYAAESLFCDLTLDGTWLGVYTWGERAKRDDDRIAISDGTDGQSFIVKNDDGGLGFMDAPDFYGQWLLVWPHQATASPEAVENVRGRLRALHTALADPDPEAIWSIVDRDSAVDWVILEESSRNNDAYFLSVYLWQDAGGLIHFMPWDLDLAFGGYPDTSCGWDAWVSYRASAIASFARSSTFTARLSERWAELRAGILHDDEVMARMDRYREVMGDALPANFSVWPIDEIQFCWGGECWLCPIESWEAEQAYVRAWTLQHFAWMDANVGAYAAGP